MKKLFHMLKDYVNILRILEKLMIMKFIIIIYLFSKICMRNQIIKQKQIFVKGN